MLRKCVTSTLRTQKFIARPSIRFYTTPSFNTIEFKTEENVAIVTLNRPKAYNALNKELCSELKQVITQIEKDDNIKATIITGAGKAFAAGADIKEMQPQSFTDVYNGNIFGDLDAIKDAKKPIIAAVNGYALGGGCELAMMCDIIIAADDAQFGQPEIKLGTIPGIGGTQRLTRAIGKSRAMEWILTGELYGAEEAYRIGLISKVVPPEKLMDESIEMAKKIAKHSLPILKMAKETVNKAFETTLEQGLVFEKRVFQSTFATKDQKEGMKAFVEKRAPKFTNE